MSELAAFVAHGPHHHGGRIGLILLALIVIGGGVWMLVRWTDRRSARRRDGGGSEAPWAPPPPSDPLGSVRSQSGAPPGVPMPGASMPAAAMDWPAPASPSLTPSDRPRHPARITAATAGDYAVEVHGLTKRFGANVAVDDVELLVPRGCAFGYLGPNGAGKTTLIRTLLGLTHADGGTMSLLGLPMPSDRARALARVGAIVDEPRFHRHLTGRQNLQILAAARGGEAGARIAPSLGRVGLQERADHRVGSYSMGMRQRLGVAACLLGDPELLILDEPMNGLDPAGMHEMRTMIESLVDEGRTVMLSSHLLDEVERTCDAVAIVDHGRVIRHGTIDELVRGANTVVRIGCSDPALAASTIEQAATGATVVSGDLGVTVTLPAGATRDAIADVVRRLVERQVAIYSVEELRASLEDWFLSVTSRLGDDRSGAPVPPPGGSLAPPPGRTMGPPPGGSLAPPPGESSP